MKKTIIVSVLIFIILLPLVAAIGIRPAQTEIISEETKSLSDEFWVINNEERSFGVQINVEGEMAEYVTISNKNTNFREDDEAKKIEFEIKLPSKLPPGESYANIIVEEQLPDLNANVVSSKQILKHRIKIVGPYPDKFITTKLNFLEQSDKIRLAAEVENKGKLNLNKVQTTFYVNDKELKEQVLETSTVSLAKGENKILDTHIDKESVEQGVFEVAAVTKYDNQKVEIVKKLIVGKPEIDVVYFDKFFIANKINKYSMELLNKWNEKIENVFVDVNVKKDAETVDNFRTKSIELEGYQRERISDYLNANEKNPGTYTFEMIVNFWSIYKMNSKSFEVEFMTEDEYESVPQAASPQNNTFMYLLFAILIVLILGIGLVVFLMLRKKDGKKSKKKK